MYMDASILLQIIISISQNCALRNSDFEITTLLLLQCLPLVIPSQSSCHKIGGLAYPNQMVVHDTSAEASPATYQRSSNHPQAFGCTPLDFILLLPQLVSKTLLDSCYAFSLVDQKIGKGTLPMVRYGL
jgi:hypothetical protein